MDKSSTSPSSGTEGKWQYVLSLPSFVGRKVSLLLAASIITSFVFFAAEVLFAKAISIFIENLGAQIPARFSIDPLGLEFWLRPVAVLFGVGVFRSVLVWLNGYLLGAVGDETKNIMRCRLLAWAFKSGQFSGGKFSNAFNEQVSQTSMVVHNFQLFITQSVLAVLSLAVLSSISWQTTGFVLLLVLILGTMMRQFDASTTANGRHVAKLLRTINDLSFQGIKNILFLKISGTAEIEGKKVISLQRQYLAAMHEYHQKVSLKYVLPQLGGLSLILCLSFFPNLMPIKASFIAYFYILFRMLQALSEVARIRAVLMHTMPHLREMYQLWKVDMRGADLDLEGESSALEAKAKAPSAAKLGAGSFGWTIESVDLQLGNTQVLKNFSLSIPENSFTLILGPSGSGKSTLLSVLLGLLKPDKGQVFLQCGGNSLQLPGRELNLGNHIGYVGPESFLIEGSILDNLRYGWEASYSQEDLKAALSIAEADFVWDLSGGLEYKILDQGQGLSSGQKQRLCLARAFLKKPKALILDEATSNLDYETENKVLRNLEASLLGKTTVVAVSHRGNSRGLAGQIVKMESK